MRNELIPELSNTEMHHYFSKAERSERKRHPKILHKKGDYNNKVVNFVLSESYMQPHLHPGNEKIEKMFLIEGSFALIIFNDIGKILKTIILEKGKVERIEVPAYTWHTYVMLTEKVAIYETMEGVYEPLTWKEMASWAPTENTPGSNKYLNFLKNSILA